MTVTISLDAHYTPAPYTKMPLVSNINGGNTVLPTSDWQLLYTHYCVAVSVVQLQWTFLHCTEHREFTDQNAELQKLMHHLCCSLDSEWGVQWLSLLIHDKIPSSALCTVRMYIHFLIKLCNALTWLIRRSIHLIVLVDCIVNHTILFLMTYNTKVEYSVRLHCLI